MKILDRLIGTYRCATVKLAIKCFDLPEPARSGRCLLCGILPHLIRCDTCYRHLATVANKVTADPDAEIGHIDPAEALRLATYARYAAELGVTKLPNHGCGNSRD